MTITLTDDRAVAQLEDWQQLEIAVGKTGYIDSMPETFWRDLVDYGIETVEQFEEAYSGQYDSGADFSEQLCNDCGYLADDHLPTFITNHIDWEDVWECELRHDYCIIKGKNEYDYRFFARHF
tara:strand:- start:21 stop:389 length:369 start_codon:yes stop_codon:yes gene_type:complete